MHTKILVEDGTPVLFIAGRLGHDAAAELQSEAVRHTSNGGSDCVIDLSGVDYISSASLKMLQSIAEQQSQNGRRLRLRAPSVAARFALELSGLIELID